MPRPALPPDDPLGAFSISTHAYKVVDGGHEVLVDVLIPKTLLFELGPGSEEWKKGRPVSVRVHGGGLVTGRRTDAPYVPLWLYSFAHKHNAIVVSPDYRLLPEATIEELLDDLDDFWVWLERDLPGVVRDVSAKAVAQARASANITIGGGLEVDLDRVLLHGESAGGYCAIQIAISAFQQHSKSSTTMETTPGIRTPRIRALVPIYPMCDFRNPHWTEAYHKNILDMPQLPASTIDDHLASIRDTERATGARPVVSSAEYTSTRVNLFFAAVQQGRLDVLLQIGTENKAEKEGRVHIEDRLAASGAKLPPTLLVTGTADSGVPVECVDRLAASLREHFAAASREGEEEGRERFMYARIEGQEHGFDKNLDPEDEEWMRKGLDFIEKAWLGDD